MNPIDRRHPTDYDKYREQYMSALRMQASNNQKNQNANIFRKQGIPPQSPTDFRTTTEKTADVEGLKGDLRSFIKSVGICNSNGANEVVQELSEEELRDLLRYKDFISKDFKGKNVPANIFVKYLRAFMRKQEQTMGVEYGLQQATGENILLSKMTIQNRIPTIEQLISFEELVLEIMGKLGMNSRTSRIAFRNAEEVLRACDIEEIKDPSLLAAAEVLRNSALASFPTAADIKASAAEMIVAQQNNDIKAAADAVERAYILVGGINEAQLKDARMIQNLKKQKSSNEEDEGYESEEDAEEEAKKGAAPEYDRGSFSPKRGRKAHKSSAIPDDATEAEFSRYTKLRRKEFLEKKGLIPSNSILKSADLQKKFNLWRIENPLHGRGLKGTGLGRKIMRAVAKKTKIKKPIELSEGYEQPKLYKQLGRYLIGTYHLANNIVCIKRPNINKSLLNKHISNDLVAIFRKLLKKEQPSFDELTNLSADEKEILHKVVKLCVLDVSVPKPESESIQEKDLHRFEILKGEITAGNDNAKLVKEFKVLLMKLVNANRVARKDAHDILTDLAANGL